MCKHIACAFIVFLQKLFAVCSMEAHRSHIRVPDGLFGGPSKSKHGRAVPDEYVNTIHGPGPKPFPLGDQEQLPSVDCTNVIHHLNH